MKKATLTPVTDAVLISIDMLHQDNLLQLIETNLPYIQIVAKASDLIAGRKLIDEYQPTMVFVELEKTFCEGNQLLNMLQPINFEIIFINTCANCPVLPWRYVATNYLNSVQNIESLKSAVSEALIKIAEKHDHHYLNILEKGILTEQQQMSHLFVHSMGDTRIIKMQDIVFLEANGSYTDIQLLNQEKVKCSKNLSQIEKEVPELLFCKVNRSFIIHLFHIERFSKDNDHECVVMKGGTEIPLTMITKTELIALLKN